MKTLSTVIAMGVLAGAAWAQPTLDGHQHAPVPAKTEGPTAAPDAPAAAPPPFQSLAKKGPDGKVIRVEGVVDLLAFEQNVHTPPAVRESIKPAVLNWIADVDQLAIDNLDFLEQLDPGEGKKGMLDKININDKVMLTQMSQMMNQLMSAGPLTAHLEAKGVLTRDQSGQNQLITGDYLQQCMNEIQAEQAPAELAGNEEKAKEWRVNNLTKFLYSLSCKDPVVSYRRMLGDAATNIDAVVAGLGPEVAKKVESEVANVKAAKSKALQREAVRKLMSGLTFEQRRALLTKARELAPVVDPYVNNMS